MQQWQTKMRLITTWCEIRTQFDAKMHNCAPLCRGEGCILNIYVFLQGTVRELHFVLHAQGCEARTVKLQDYCQKNVAPRSHYQSGSLPLIQGPQVLHEEIKFLKLVMVKFFNPPASKASRGAANLTEGKNMLRPVYGVK